MITKTVEIKLSGKDLADELWELDCQEQADFFNKNGFVKDNFNHGCALIQIDRIVELLDENGRKFIEKLYSSLQGLDDMRKEDEGKMKYYWFTFSDGYSVCVKGFSKQELRVEENKHGRLLRKVEA